MPKKVGKKVDINYDDFKDLIQFPTRHPKGQAPSADPVPISDSVPPIEPPSEVLQVIAPSDWEMYSKMFQRYGAETLKKSGIGTDDLTRFVQGYAKEKDRDKATFDRMDRLFETFDKFGFNTLLDQPMANGVEEKLLSIWPSYCYGYDKMGHPVVYDEVGNANPKDLDEAFGDKEKLRLAKIFRYRFMLRVCNVKRIQNMRYGYDASINQQGGVNAITKQVAVMDIGGMYAKSMRAKYRNMMNDICGDNQDLWPNTLETMFIINAPWSFRAAWKMIKMFLHPVTAAKVKIVGSDYLKYLKEKIPIDQIPEKYGGQGKMPIKLGYAADIDNELLDKNYSSQPDPLKLDGIGISKEEKADE